MAMTAIGLNTNVKKLIGSGVKPLVLGFSLLGMYRTYRYFVAKDIRYILSVKIIFYIKQLISLY